MKDLDLCAPLEFLNLLPYQPADLVFQTTVESHRGIAQQQNLEFQTSPSNAQTVQNDLEQCLFS